MSEFLFWCVLALLGLLATWVCHLGFKRLFPKFASAHSDETGVAILVIIGALILAVFGP